MKNIQEIEVVLIKMAELLRKGALDDWASVLESFQGEVQNEPKVTTARILAMYGGMGSFNDLILYSNGQPLVEENMELDALRTELYQLCQQVA